MSSRSFKDFWDVVDLTTVQNTDTTEIRVQLLKPKGKNAEGRSLQLGLSKFVKTERYTGPSGGVTFMFEILEELITALLFAADEAEYDAEEILRTVIDTVKSKDMEAAAKARNES